MFCLMDIFYLNWISKFHSCLINNKWKTICIRVMVMMFNTTFNNISVISWRSVLLVEETGIPWENHWSAVSHWQTLSHNVVSSTPVLLVAKTRLHSENHWPIASHWETLSYNVVSSTPEKNLLQKIKIYMMLLT
jgi:hypothetical protein